MHHETAITWAIDYLTINSYIVHKPYEIVCAMPWSKVIRFATNKGLVYCKQTTPIFYIEPAIMQVLAQYYPTNIPKVLATNSDLYCFLMQDVGNPLRNYLKIDYQTDLFCKSLKTYANIQNTMIKHIDKVLSAGAQDYRLKKLPDLYLQLINKEELLLSDGVTADELNVLYALHPIFTTKCELLKQYNIPETIEHGDFHDNNILIHEGNIAINDRGEATIAHPFFSLACCLHNAMRTHNLQETDGKYLALQQSYLENWLEYAPMDKLQEAFLLTKRLRHFYFVLGFSCIKTCPGIETLQRYYGYIARSLREFIGIFKDAAED